MARPSHMALYKLFIPPQAVGASLIYFDLWNPGVGYDLDVLSVAPIVSNAVAVTGLVGVDLYLTRSIAIGTGGTAATAEGTSLSAATFSAVDNSQPINLNTISARLTPSGGATAGAVLSLRSLSTEETGGASYEVMEMISSRKLIVPKASGIRVIQGSVASVGNIGFDILLDWRPR